LYSNLTILGSGTITGRYWCFLSAWGNCDGAESSDESRF